MADFVVLVGGTRLPVSVFEREKLKIFNFFCQIKIMKALEDDSDFRLKTLKENDMDNKDIEEIKTRLKVRKHHRKYYSVSDPNPR
jgi:hypothetical protein